MGQAQREGWDPTSRQKGYLTTRADTVATQQFKASAKSFCYQLYGAGAPTATRRAELVSKDASTRMSTSVARL
jgi:hypothetical protein